MAGLAGCLQTTEVACGDGAVCAAGTVCRPDGTCADEDAVAACDGLAPGDACTLPTGGGAGVCADGLCVAVGCGNGVLEAGERCDDGNQVARDGCSADCQSDETCGNQVVDPLQGEQCDDGGALSGDGCSSGCLVEVPAWAVWASRDFQPGQGPTSAYDPRAEAVLIVGRSELWSFDGLGARALGQAPTLQAGAAAVFDETRGELLLVGAATGVVGVQTWALVDPTAPVTIDDWQLVSEAGPTARRSMGLVWDRAGARAVLFGGASGLAARGDTWAWQGGAWTQLAPLASPPARFGHGMAYDPTRGRVVLIGGRDDAINTTYFDVWEFDGATWAPGVAVDAPSIGATGGATWAGDLGAVVAVTANGAAAAYDGVSWSALAATGQSISQGEAPSLAYDPRRGAVVIVASSYYDPGLHDLVGGAWSSYYPWLFTAPHEQTAAAYDRQRAMVVRFGGVFGDGDTAWNHLLGYDGQRWVELARRSPTRPANRWGAALVYDPTAQDLVLFGGADYFNGGGFGDTWILHDDVWTARPIAGPPPRMGAGMVYDAARDVIVLFGGAGEGGNFDPDVPLADTWIFDGAAWAEVPGGAPPARRWPLLAYDEARGVTVLHGGESGTLASPTLLTDTWEFDGATWTPRLVASPPARRRGAMAYDPLLGGVSLYGGRETVFDAASHGHWLFDGDAWTEVVYEQGQPPDIYGHTMAFDAARRRMVVVGGISQVGALELRFDAPASEAEAPTESCVDSGDVDGDGLAGCDDPDCWGRCAPSCAPATSCATPGCGDGECNLTLEMGDLCAVDCDVCGDGVCAPGFETAASCATDCAPCGDATCAAGESAASCPGDCG